MSILSTNTRLIKVGQDYSAGSGISIDENVISVTGEFGKTYSAGDNIDIYEQGEQLYISSKDWEQDIANASSNAYNEAIAQIPDPFDPSFISGQVDNKLDTTAFTAWQNGQYSTDLQTIEGQISNKLDESAFSQVSASFLTAINIPESAVWQDVSTTVQSNSAQWAEGGSGDEEVNALVHSNSGTWNEVSAKVDTTAFTSWQNGQYTTDLQTIEGQISNKYDTSSFAEVSGSFQPSGDYAKRDFVLSSIESSTSGKLDVSSFASVSGDFLTNEDLNNYYTKDETSGKEELANAFANIPTGDVDVNNYVQNNSATIDETVTTYQTNSGSYQPSGNYIPYTAVDSVFPAFETNSGLEIKTNTVAGSLSNTYINESHISLSYINSNLDINNRSVLSNGSLDFKTNSDSAYVDREKIHTWDSASNYIQNISGTFNEVSTTVQSNSAQWAEGVNQEVESYVQNNSATINEVNTTYQSNSSRYITEHQSLNGYATEEWVTGQGYITGVSIPESATWNEVSQAYENASATYLTSVNIPESAVWQDVSTTVQSNSSQWAEGGSVAISSYTTTWCSEVPPYGDHVINSLNGKFISAFISKSADNSKKSIESERAKSANYAQAVNETYVENKGFTRNLSSEYGTISVIHNNIIESTNSAISRVGNEGFVSAFERITTGPTVTATYTWDKSLPNTTFNFKTNYGPTEKTVTYSANTNLTGEFTITARDKIPFSVEVPNATEIKLWSNDWIGLVDVVASAADSFETTVCELAWASALPTYEYDNTNKISAINGSALAGGGDVPTGTMNVTGLEYNAVNEISAYNGSAIAQYGAEKQWLVHDDTLCHLSNSAQYALGVNVSALQRLMGIDETVLFESPNATGTKLSNGIDLSEGKSNFDKIRLLYSLEQNQPMEYKDIPMYGANTGTNLVWGTTLPYDNVTGASWCLEWKVICTATDTHIQSLNSIYWGKAECDGTSTHTGVWVQGSNINVPIVFKVVGIGRKA